MIKVTITESSSNNELPLTGGPSSGQSPIIRPPTCPFAMSTAEFSARSLFVGYLGLMVQIAQNKDLRDAFTDPEDNDQKNEKARKMLKDTGIIIPEYVNRIYLDERKRFCGVNYCKDFETDNPIALDIEEAGKKVNEDMSGLDGEKIKYDDPGLDVFSTEEISIIQPDGKLLDPGDFEKYKCRIPDYPLKLKDKYKYYYHISHPDYRELNIQIEGVSKHDRISVRVPYGDVENQAIQNYKLSGEDDIVLCSS